MKRRRFTRGRRYIRRFYRRAKRAKLYRRTAPSERKKSRCHQTDTVLSIELLPIPVSITDAELLNSVLQNHVNAYIGCLYVKSLVYPAAPPSGTGDITNRRQNTVFISGWKIQRQFYWISNVGQGESQNEPVVVNWALIQPKSKYISDLLNTGTEANMTTILTSEFFTQQASNTTDYVPFLSNTTTICAWRHNKNNLAMNPNNNFNIITRKKKTLYPSQWPNHSRQQWTINKWMPYKKWVEFETPSDILPHTPIYEIYWYEQLTPKDYPTNTVEVLRTWNSHKVYFHDK